MLIIGGHHPHRKIPQSIDADESCSLNARHGAMRCGLVGEMLHDGLVELCMRLAHPIEYLGKRPAVCCAECEVEWTAVCTAAPQSEQRTKCALSTLSDPLIHCMGWGGMRWIRLVGTAWDEMDWIGRDGMGWGVMGCDGMGGVGMWWDGGMWCGVV